MDSKVSPQKVKIPIVFSPNKGLHQASLPLLRSYLESWKHNKRLLAKSLQGLPQRLNMHIQERFKGQYSTDQFLIHVVKEGETLTLISKQYGVSIQSIAEVNEKLANIDFVLRGQCLNIPSYSIKDAKKNLLWKSWSFSVDARNRFQRSLNIFGGCENNKIYTVLSSHYLMPAKTTGYFLLLVPLIAFCIRCIISALHHRVSEDLKHGLLNKSEAHQRGSRSMRWKSALSDIRESDDLGAESGQDSSYTPEDQPPVPFEEISHAYTELEPAYQKFLSDCGMSESGYWRGGSPD